MEVGMDSSVIRPGILTSDPDKDLVVSLMWFCILHCICVLICALVEEINKYITAVFIGLSAGTILLLATNGRTSKVLDFDEKFLFRYLLPPIIFNAGFQVKERNFIKNFTTITLFGAGGTLISFCLISFGAKMLFEMLDIGYLDLRDYLAIGVIFSATDSLSSLHVLNQHTSPLLYNIVIGEGVINDATSLALFSTIHKCDFSHVNSRIAIEFVANFFYLSLASALFGVLSGLLSGYIIKKLYSDRDSRDREIAFVPLMAYLSYIVAEIINLSGILTLFFCGVVMSHYTLHILTKSSESAFKVLIPEMSDYAKIFIFLYVGMDALDMEKLDVVGKSPGKTIAASSLLFGLVGVARALFIFVLSYISNSAKKSKNDKLNLKQQVKIGWAGLVRGTFSMVLAYYQFAGRTQQQPGIITMITYTITIVLFTAMGVKIIDQASSKPFDASIEKKGE